MKKNIAHIITLINIVMAIIAIIQSFYFQFSIASSLIFICFFLDGLDGSIARWLNIQTEFGKQLDSLSDLVAFGIAPSMLMYNFINYEFNYYILSYIALIIPVFSTLRLARYNITKSQNIFLGITTPVSALFLSAIPLINLYEKNELIRQIIINPYTVTISIIILCILLISKLPTFSIRIDSIKNDKRKLSFLVISMMILSIFNFAGLILIIFIYIILNIFRAIN